jgi:hypothetical protein
MNSDQHKEHIINVIERIKQQNIIIEKKLQELSIFYITNKEKYDYELVKTYFNNFLEFKLKYSIDSIGIYSIDSIGMPVTLIPPTSIFFSNDNYKSFLLSYNQEAINMNSSCIPEHREINKQNLKDLLNKICNEEEDKLFHLMVINEKKLKCYENIKKLYFEPESEKPVIEKNSIISSNKTLIALDEAYSKIEEYGTALDDAYSKINKYEIKFSELYSESKYERLEIEKNSIISSNKTLIALAEAYSKIEEYGTTLDEAYSKINKYEKKLTELYSESKCEKLVIEKNSIISNELVISSNKTLIALDKAYSKIEEYGTALDDAYSKINKYEIKLAMYTESNCEKPVIEKKQYSVSASVIFFIMIVFYVITVMTVVLIVNYNYNYNYDVMHHSMQCSHNTRLIDKHNKLADKDIMII